MTIIDDDVQRVEHHRIKEVYDRYEGGRGAGWSAENPGNRLIEQERNRAIVDSLRSSGTTGPILDLGCGYGAMLDELTAAGFRSERLFGAEILFDRCRRVRSGQADGRVVQVDGLTAPFRSGSLDAVVAMTVFSSILDDGIVTAVASEIDRVLRPGGSLHVYDMAIPSPWNPNVRRVSEKGLAHRFAGYESTSRPLTVLPPVARRLGRRTDDWYLRLSRLPLLRSHRLIRLTKPSVEPMTP